MVKSGQVTRNIPFFHSQMPLSWTEIKDRAVHFSKEWDESKSEKAESQSFWNAFFNVFGVQRRTVATFEEKVRNIKGQFGFIDLFWRGKMLAEHKSQGKSLDKATSQAFEYIQCLKDENRDDEIPRYVIVSDFAKMVLYDLEPEEGDPPILEFPLRELHKHIHAFAFIPGYKIHRFAKEDAANIKAAELMGKIHDALAEQGYSGHFLERFLVRILFCLFAEDTGIFEPNAFTTSLEQTTKEDGSDLGPMLTQLFEVLDTPTEKRQKQLEEVVATLPFVNGGLFEETLRSPACNRKIRDAILTATRFDWSRISPAVFGSLFQAVMIPKERRELGAHYTSEADILKVIHPLFLDDLKKEFVKCKGSRKKLVEFHRKLSSLTFFDPACGCGNFLVLAYRELRLLEMDVLQAIYYKESFDLVHLVQVDVNQFYGIEILEFPVCIAETALWIMDHQMNMLASERFGKYFLRLPLVKSAKIVHGNSLTLDWAEVLPKEKCSYILSNPPYVGKHCQSKSQKEDVKLICGSDKKCGILDYVSCWYFKAADYIQTTSVRVGFVSTNSIVQGEQAGVLWPELFSNNISIYFAFPSFVWTSEARGKAHVHCVIIGFGLESLGHAKYLYEEAEGKMRFTSVSNISPYLIEGRNTTVPSRTKPLCEIPEIIFGSKSTDGGHLMLSNAEKEEFVRQYPEHAGFVRQILGSEEYINGIKRFCLWLFDANPREISRNPEIKRRVEEVKKFRLASQKAATRQNADIPTLFTEMRQPKKKYLAIPKTSSEKRKYIPMGFVSPHVIANTGIFAVPGATLYHFGVLTSTMHMDWMRRVCGRLEMRYRYSAKLVYNNFPWPVPNEKQRLLIEEKAKAVLDARELYPDCSLADLYSSDCMPKELVKAHKELDRAVEKAYRSKPFQSERERIEFLFAMYEKLTK